MQVPPEIVLRGVQATPEIDKLMTRGIARLEQVCDYIVSTRIAVEQAQGRHQTGNPYHMRIDIRIPGRSDIVVNRSSKGSRRIPDGRAELQTKAATRDEPDVEGPQLVRRNPIRTRGVREEPLWALVRRSFDSARRELEKVVDKQRGEVKVHGEQQAQAMVEKIFREQGYGFLRTLDGEQVYFHRNSVLHDHWEGLKIGTAVRYASEMGEKGLQASTVEPVERPGAAEAHDELHDLPSVSPQPVSGKKAEGGWAVTGLAPSP